MCYGSISNKTLSLLMNLEGAPLEINLNSSVQSFLPSQRLQSTQSPEDVQEKLHFDLLI